MAKGDDILERLIDLSVRIMEITSSLPADRTTTHIGAQLLRCGSSPAANYAEARSGESRRDFVHKLGIVLKELNESLVWLKMTRRLRLIAPFTLDPIEKVM